ncbi:hypothetical protein ACGFYE_11780 [Streptomyces zaomyceticus]|uniref:hypothetical protein n=1 Tax=Streptomyces zaomyceticus TaxID=68286 RepID=UPI00371B8217
MSTTTTGADPGRTPRRARLRLPFRRGTGPAAGGTRRTADPAGERRVPLVTESRREERVRRTARRRGRAVAKGRVLDPWVLGSGDRVPYFAELASVRDLLHARMSEEALREETRLRAAGSRAGRAAVAAEADVRRLEDRLADNRKWLDTNRRQLDRLAARSVRWERFRDGVRERVEERWLRARFGELALDEGADGRGREGAGAEGGADDLAGRPGDVHGTDAPGRSPEDGYRDHADDAPGGPDATPHGPPDDDEDYQSLDRDPADRDAASSAPARPALHRLSDRPASAENHAARAQADATEWEGLPGRPGLPRWMVWSLLLVIAAVEVPIYWIAFQPFHGSGNAESDTLSGTLAVSAAIVMVVVPHLAGRALRGGSGTGSLKWANLPALTLIGVWGFSTWALGHLRSKLVFRHREPERVPAEYGDVAGLGDPQPTLIDSLHLEQTTVTWMFVALLVLSGGIGLLLGLLREHPYLDSYRSHLERGTRLERQREDAVTAAQRARAVEASATDDTELRAEATRARQRATTELYEAAAHAFLMGVAERSSDPAVTEAAMRLSNTWPLLPFPRTAPGG